MLINLQLNIFIYKLNYSYFCSMWYKMMCSDDLLNPRFPSYLACNSLKWSKVYDLSLQVWPWCVQLWNCEQFNQSEFSFAEAVLKAPKWWKYQVLCNMKSKNLRKVRNNNHNYHNYVCKTATSSYLHLAHLTWCFNSCHKHSPSYSTVCHNTKEALSHQHLEHCSITT